MRFTTFTTSYMYSLINVSIKKSVTIAVLALMCGALAIKLYACTNNRNLIVAVEKGDVKTAQLYLTRLSNINVPAYDGWTALTIAARNGDLKVLQWLMEKGADVNSPDGAGNTALFWASFYGHTDIVLFLLNKGAKKSARCKNCNSPMDIAIARGHHDIVSILESTEE